MRECATSRAPNVKTPRCFPSGLVVEKWICASYAPGTKIYPDQMKKNEAIYDGMRQVLCARYKRPTAFNATLSLKNGYAPVMRQVLKVWSDQNE